jgi:hypothetical protein
MTRMQTRALLRGTLAPGGDGADPEQRVLAEDAAASVLFEASKAAAQLVEWLEGEDLDELAAKADRCEVQVWGLFMRRLQSLAGEV